MVLVTVVVLVLVLVMILVPVMVLVLVLVMVSVPVMVLVLVLVMVLSRKGENAGQILSPDKGHQKLMREIVARVRTLGERSGNAQKDIEKLGKYMKVIITLD